MEKIKIVVVDGVVEEVYVSNPADVDVDVVYTTWPKLSEVRNEIKEEAPHHVY